LLVRLFPQRSHSAALCYDRKGLMKNTAKLEQLTSLRFFAALMIVFHHAAGMFGDGMFGIGRSPVPLGQGVSFFFVLSGFILAFVYPSLDSRREVRRFWLARFARIWPAYLATFLLTYALLFYDWDSLTGVAHVAMVQAWLPLSVFYFSYNAVAWSISTEVFFYLAFPVLIRDWARTWQVKLAATVALLVALVAFTNTLHLPNYESESWNATVHGMIYINPLARLLEFVTGMVLARFWAGTRAPSARWTVAEIVALGACGAVMNYTAPFAEVIRRPLGDAAAMWMAHSGSFLAFALVVFVMAQGAGAISRLLRLRPFVVLGEISFSMYLLHHMLLWVWRRSEWREDIMGAVLFFSALLGLSALVWAVVEMPARRRIRSLAPTSSSSAHEMAAGLSIKKGA
jgi:peptidoglycan/LPS O-acetylase OafA/YrhL